MIDNTSVRRPTSACDIDEMTDRIATLDGEATDRLIDAQIAAAVREHRIEDAIGWQRVRLRARRRAAAATAACRA